MPICLASPATTSGSTPTFPPPKTSPESFNITRLYGPFTPRIPLSAVEAARAMPTLPALCRGSCSCDADARSSPASATCLCAGRLEPYEPQHLDACLVELLAE